MWLVKQKLCNINIGAQAILGLLVLLSILFLHPWFVLVIFTLLALLIAAYLSLLIPLLKRLLPIVYLGSVIILLHTLVNPHNRHFIFFLDSKGSTMG